MASTIKNQSILKPIASAGAGAFFINVMNYRPKYSPRLSEKEMLQKLHNAALEYKPYADQIITFVFRENKNTEYSSYTVQFGKRNFMHLAGIKSKTLNAVEFYEACLSGIIKKEDCTPKRDPMTMYAKIDVMGELFDFRNSKCYKIGEKTTVTSDNDFEFATGNYKGLIGYDHRINIAGSHKVDKKRAAIPTTLLGEPLYDYCVCPQKIMFVLEQDSRTMEFDNIIYEIKKGLFLQEKDNIFKTI